MHLDDEQNRLGCSCTLMVSVPEEMVEVLEKERKQRYLETIPEAIRVILSDYFRKYEDIHIAQTYLGAYHIP
jgi:metal-responsive CopG/Arc/MetJ family transcriptional regulator